MGFPVAQRRARKVVLLANAAQRKDEVLCLPLCLSVPNLAGLDPYVEWGAGGRDAGVEKSRRENPS